MKFLTDPPQLFELFETMLVDGAAGIALETGTSRGWQLRRSTSALRSISLQRSGCSAPAGSPLRDGRWRVRLSLAADGQLTFTAPTRLPASATSISYVISPNRADPADLFLFHKTTRRDLYDGEHAALAEAVGATR